MGEKTALVEWLLRRTVDKIEKINHTLMEAGFFSSALQFLKFVNSPYTPLVQLESWRLFAALQALPRLLKRQGIYEATNPKCHEIIEEIYISHIYPSISLSIYICVYACISISLCIYTSCIEVKSSPGPVRYNPKLRAEGFLCWSWQPLRQEISTSPRCNHPKGSSRREKSLCQCLVTLLSREVPLTGWVGFIPCL